MASSVSMHFHAPITALECFGVGLAGKVTKGQSRGNLGAYEARLPTAGLARPGFNHQAATGKATVVASACLLVPRK